ncbi:MAG: glycosyltransferase [Lachnospiraceae bacterium]|nr:glycosyltransferase [Lachnospiraceae bacterium]
MDKILLACPCMPGLEKAFREMGFKICKLEEPLEKLALEKTISCIKECAEKEHMNYVFTFSFNPDLAEACFRFRVKYISWIWDSPHSVLWAKEARYETNYIFVFDYQMYVKQQARGLTHVFYLPLSADWETFQKKIAEDADKSRERFGGDVTFLGNFYNDGRHDLYDQIQYLPPYVEGYMEGLMNAQRKLWGADLLDTCISDGVWAEFKKYVKWDLGDRYEEGYYESNMYNNIGQKVAQLERKELCSCLAQKFNFTVYSDCDTSFDPTIVNKGHADYVSEMPLIFHYSKINIHVTIRCIPSGVALRVMDVLASEGFLLTNYQPEIAEYFEDGKELVMYSDFEDLYEKIAYYLEHEEERKAIAHAGYLKVREYFSYKNQLETMMGVVKQDEESCDHS